MVVGFVAALAALSLAQQSANMNGKRYLISNPNGDG